MAPIISAPSPKATAIDPATPALPFGNPARLSPLSGGLSVEPANSPEQRPHQRSVPVLGHTFNSAQQTPLYSNSAPASAVFHPLQTPKVTRPPVPLFSHSTGSIHQQNTQSVNTMADVNIAGGLEGIGAGFGPTFGHFDPSSDINWDEYTASANFTAINEASTTTQTVSPKDLFNDHPLASAPPSAAFTNLTSPSINESPYVADSYETSPLFQDELAGSDNWYPLFPEGGDPLQRTISDQSIAQTSSSSNSPLVLDTSHLRKSSNDRSPLTQALHHRHSSVSGVKPRRRKGPLPPISVDPEDRIAVKRARNTLAARESRQRKVDHVQTLERQISDLKGENERLKRILASVGYTEPLS